MHDQIFLQRLFDGYINCFGRNRWHYWMKDSDATQEEIGHFRNLGLMLGYIPIREWTGDRVRTPRDLVWLTQRQYQRQPVQWPQNPVFLHLERESNDTNCLPCVDDQNNKLLNAAGLNDGRFLVGVFGWIKQKTWDLCVQSVRANTGYLDRKVLLIGCIGATPEKVSEIKRMVWVDNKAVCREAHFGWDNGGFWYAYFLSDWSPC